MNLPKSYIKVALGITGYFGTYLPSLRLEPGTIFRISDGVPVREAHLDHFPEFQRDQFPLNDQPESQSTAIWNTQSVQMDVINVQAQGPANVAGGAVRLRFGRANEAAIICNAVRYQAFADVLKLRALLRQLRRQNQWDDALCVVTEVVHVSSAWICFSTAANQEARISANAPLALPADPTGALAKLAGSASVEASHEHADSSAFCSTLPDGGTPLFQALRFNRSFLNLFGTLEPKLDFSRSEPDGPPEFEEPSFDDA